MENGLRQVNVCPGDLSNLTSKDEPPDPKVVRGSTQSRRPRLWLNPGFPSTTTSTRTAVGGDGTIGRVGGWWTVVPLDLS